MSDEARKPEALVKEAQAFPDLAIDFSTKVAEKVETVAKVKVEYLPVVFVPAPAPAQVKDPPVPDLPYPPSADPTVTDDDAQRLLYYWMTNRPRGFPMNIVAAPAPAPVVTPFRRRRGGMRWDGVRRMIKLTP